MRTQLPLIGCAQCQMPFRPRDSRNRFCSGECYRIYWRHYWRTRQTLLQETPCEKCHALVIKTRQSRFCEACRHPKSVQPIVESRPCRTCGNPVGRGPGGYLLRYCSPVCYQTPIAPLRSANCLNCAQPFETGRAQFRQFCPPCGLERQLQRHNVLDGPTRRRLVKLLRARDGDRCGICRRPVNFQRVYPDPRCASLDHLIPVSAGGNGSLANLQLAHLSCNVRRSNRGPAQLLLLGTERGATI